MFPSRVETVQVLKFHVSIFDTISVKTGSCCPSRSGLILYQGQSWGGRRSDPLLRMSSSPQLLRFDDSRMWIVLTSVSSSALLPQPFTLGPSPLGCPPYYVNYDPHHHQSSDQIPLLTLGILAQLIHQTRKGAHASAVHACLSLFMCEN